MIFGFDLVQSFKIWGAFHTVTISLLLCAMIGLLPLRALVPPTVRFKHQTSDSMPRNQAVTYEF